MTFSHEVLTAAHKHCSNNHQAIQKSALCGCFYCEQVYPASAVAEYVRPGQDAICPKCGIDSVLAEASELPLSQEFLSAMYDRWFTSEIEIQSLE